MRRLTLYLPDSTRGFLQAECLAERLARLVSLRWVLCGVCWGVWQFIGGENRKENEVVSAELEN